jgi:hypothetical protein
VWGITFEPRTSVVEVAVSRVRRKLAQVSSRVRVYALRNVGFVATDDRARLERLRAAAPNGGVPERRASGSSG